MCRAFVWFIKKFINFDKYNLIWVTIKNQNQMKINLRIIRNRMDLRNRRNRVNKIINRIANKTINKEVKPAKNPRINLNKMWINPSKIKDHKTKITIPRTRPIILKIRITIPKTWTILNKKIILPTNRNQNHISQAIKITNSSPMK